MAVTSKFNFAGELSIPRNEEKFIKHWKGGAKENIPMVRISFSVKENSHNRGFVELFGMKADPIKTMSTDGTHIEIPWEDRFDETSLNAVASYRKHYVDLGEEFGGAHQFITDYDAIEYLAENLPKYNGKLRVVGNWEKNYYNGQFTDKFRIGNVYGVSNDTKAKLELTMDYFYNLESIDKSSFKEDQKICVNGYIMQYIDKDTGNVYIPQSAILSAAKYDMDNEKHAKLWKYKKSYIEDLSKKKMSHITWECRLINGAEEVEFDESMLTEKQREQVELGIKTVDEFRPRGTTLGSKVVEVRLFDPLLTGDFVDGLVECEDTLAEFEERIWYGNTTEKLSDVLKESKPENVLENQQVVDEDEDDLF